MAFKLNKEQESRLNELRVSLSQAYDNVVSVVEDYNEVTSGPRISVEEELTEYNTKLAELKSFVDDIAAEKRDEFDDKSESWQEGDTGSTVDDWIATWENAELDEVKISFPEELSIDFENASEADLPTEP